MKPYDDEKELFESVEKGEWSSVEDLAGEIAVAREAAEATYGKDQRMNIRISSRDMSSLKIRAREDGIPYQTLVSSIIHRYLTGRLKEK
jgi:predicted DNA binding CopG/RHH family protein